MSVVEKEEFGLCGGKWAALLALFKDLGGGRSLRCVEGTAAINWLSGPQNGRIVVSDPGADGLRGLAEAVPLPADLRSIRRNKPKREH